MAKKKKRKDKGCERPKYLPTTEEIAEECRKIRKEKEESDEAPRREGGELKYRPPKQYKFGR